MSEKMPIDFTHGGEPIEGSGFEEEEEIPQEKKNECYL